MFSCWVENLNSQASLFTSFTSEVPAQAPSYRSAEDGDVQAMFRHHGHQRAPRMKGRVTDATDTHPLPSSELKVWDKLLSIDKHKGQSDSVVLTTKI